MAEPFADLSGWLAAWRRLGAAALRLGRSRRELLWLEWREARIESGVLLVLAGVAVLAVVMAVTVATLTVVVLCVVTGHLWPLLGLVCAYLLIAFLACRACLNRLARWQPFAATRTEVGKDIACWADRR